jgi:hypothetical protein
MSETPYVLCVDCTPERFRSRAWLLLKCFHCEVVGTLEATLAAISLRHPDAIVTTCPSIARSLSNLFESEDQSATEGPDGAMKGDESGPSIGRVQLVPDLPSLTTYVSTALLSRRGSGLAPQIFQLGGIEWPINVLVNRDGALVSIEGTAIATMHTRICGEMTGILHPGEVVLVDIPQVSHGPSLRARVLCELRSTYGLEFGTPPRDFPSDCSDY